MTEKPEFPDEFEDEAQDEQDQSVDVAIPDEDEAGGPATESVPATDAAPAGIAPIEERREAPAPATASEAVPGPRGAEPDDEVFPIDSPEPPARGDSPGEAPSARAAHDPETTAERPFGPTTDDEPTPQLIAIASGRGGAGKSLLAANVAVYLAQMGKRVVAVDGDPAGGTLHHMLGAGRPARGLASFLRGHATSLEELAVDTPVAGVRLIGGELQPFGAPKPKVGAGAKPLLAALRGLAADIVVIDLGPADLPLCIDVWLGADTPIVMTLSDPPSIEATYRFVRSGFLRKVRGERGVDKLQAQLGRVLPAALDLFRAAADAGRVEREPASETSSTDAGPARAATAKSSALATALGQAMASYRPRFVVSQTRSLGDTRLGSQMAMAAHRRLGHRLDYLGHMEADETVTAASRRHRPVMAEFPEAKICKNIERIVRRILSTEAERPTPVPIRLEEDQTFYEILETQPGVSDEEVRRAYRLMKEIYAAGSPAVFGLYDDAELTALHARANAAHDTLFAPERRRLYDLSLPEADLARAVRWAAQTPRESGVPSPSRVDPGSGVPVIDATTEITGPFLKKIREAKGMELSEVSSRTKIAERHLRAIEAEKFDELPAPVYVRGFVTQMARFLRIDPARAAEGYLRRFHDVNGPGGGSPALKEV